MGSVPESYRTSFEFLEGDRIPREVTLSAEQILSGEAVSTTDIIR